MLRLAIALAGAAALAYGLSRRSLSRPGSTTNASDAVDDIPLRAHPTADEMLDAGVKETFPASDPVSVPGPVETAFEKQERLRKAASGRASLP